MKRILVSIVCLSLATISYAQTDANMGIIPVPVSVVKHSGKFVLDKNFIDVIEALSVCFDGIRRDEAKIGTDRPVNYSLVYNLLCPIQTPHLCQNRCLKDPLFCGPA